MPLLLVVIAAGCGSGHHSSAPAPSASTSGASSSTSGTTTATAPSTVASTARCATSALAVWLGVGEGGSTAGSTFYPLELTNISSHACHLFGFPGVSAWRGHLLGSPAQRNHAVPEQTAIVQGEHRVSWADLDTRAASLAGAFASVGLLSKHQV